MRAVLVDDEQMVLDNLQYILGQFPEVQVVLATQNPREVAEQLDRLRPEIVFADISMAEMNGMELAERLSRWDPSVRIVFVTAHDQYALDAFRVDAVDYILKPVTTSKVRHTLQKMTRLQEGGNAPEKAVFRIIATQNNRFYVIRPEEGQYIKVVAKTLILVTAKGEYTLDHSVAHWEEKLRGYGWFRCHKGYLVNLNQIEAISPMFNCTYAIRVKGQREEITVSRTYIKEFKELLNLK